MMLFRFIYAFKVLQLFLFDLSLSASFRQFVCFYQVANCWKCSSENWKSPRCSVVEMNFCIIIEDFRLFVVAFLEKLQLYIYVAKN